MARPPQYPLDDGDSMAVAKLKVTLKEASPETRAHILRWLAKFYNDSGMMFSPSRKNVDALRLMAKSSGLSGSRRSRIDW
jgi:hypothetical protein